MKKITAGIAIIARVALCAAVWPQSTEVEDLPTEPVKTAVPAKLRLGQRRRRIFLFLQICLSP